MKVEVELVPEVQEELLKYNDKAMMPQTKDLQFDLGGFTYEDFDNGHANADYIKKTIESHVAKSFRDTYMKIWNGDMKKIANLPVESFIPLLFIKHMGAFAKEYSMTPDFIDMGFDPETLLKHNRPEAFVDRKAKLFKEIESKFTEPEEGGDQRALQFIIDENAINSFLLDFVLVDKSFSIREFMSMSKEAAPYLSKVNTSTLGMLIPQLVEEFGENRNIDVMFTTSHDLISKKLPDAKVSGFQMDRNGNFRFAVNVGFEVLVEKKGAHKQYEEARDVYMQLVAKGKVVIKEGRRKRDRMMILMAKNAEVGVAKIFKPDGEEMVVEQMVLTSGINVQLEQMIKMIRP